LLDERRLQQHPERGVQNFADAVFRLEGSRRLEDAIAVARALDEVLRAPGLMEVRRAFGQWIKALLLRRATAPMIEEVSAIPCFRARSGGPAANRGRCCRRG
jgi:hypothetical protein